MLGIAGAPRFGDLDELERNRLADGWRYATPVDAVMLEVVVGDGQSAVIMATMLGELDLDPVEHAVSG